MRSMKFRDVLWRAFQYAKQDRNSLVWAYDNDTREEVVRDALADIRAIERLQKIIFGTTKSKLEASLEKITLKSLTEVINNLDSSEESLDKNEN